MSSIRTVRWFLALEAAAFAVAVLIHRGVLVSGYAHWKAATAEGVIALVLAGGLVASLAFPAASRTGGLVCQGFALLGTCVGLFTIAVGVGPRTGLDLILHGVFVVLLASGLLVVARTPAAA
jgi:hypothetical protein